MKTNVIPREVETNTKNSKNFTIKANGKAFKTLISTMYANKIQSVTREIWSNALDSHIAAGKEDVPFEVSFPSIFEPTFRVRDFGVGLSHDEVLDLYTTMFESTKEDNDLETGKFGIGSKSPFAYTDTFSVVSVKNGHKNYYTAILDEVGIPAIHHMHHEIVDEPNGVEVSFPVGKEDASSFQSAANRISLGFDVKPLVPNISDFAWPKEWSEILTSGIYAKMGSVIYPVDENIIIDAMGKKKFEEYKVPDEFIHNMTNTLTVFHIPMGMLEMAPSRENLSYGRNEPTIPTLVKHIHEKFETINEMVRDKTDSFKSMKHVYNFINFVANDHFHYDNYDNFKSQVKHVAYNFGNETEFNDYKYWLKVMYGSAYENRYGSRSSTTNQLYWRGKPVKKNNFVKLNIKNNKGHILQLNGLPNVIKKYPKVGPMETIGFDQYHKNIFFVVDRSNESGMLPSQITKKTRNIRETLNYIIEKMGAEEKTDFLNFVFMEYRDSGDIITHFLEKISEDYIEGIDYEVVDLLSIEVPAKPKVNVDRNKKTKLQAIQNCNIEAVYYNKELACHTRHQLHLLDPELVHSHPIDPMSTLMSVNPETDYILVAHSSFSRSPIFYDGGNKDNYVFIHKMIEIYDKPVLIVTPSNVSTVKSYLPNFTRVEDLDLTPLFNHAKKVQYELNECDTKVTTPQYIFGKRYGEEVSEYPNELIYLSENSPMDKYCIICKEIVEIESVRSIGPVDLRFLQLFKRFYKDKNKEMVDELSKTPSETPRIKILVQEMKRLENEISEVYPLLKYLNMKNVDADKINDILLYINKIDNERNI